MLQAELLAEIFSRMCAVARPSAAAGKSVEPVGRVLVLAGAHRARPPDSGLPDVVFIDHDLPRFRLRFRLDPDGWYPRERDSGTPRATNS